MSSRTADVNCSTDRELAEKRAAKFDAGLEQSVSAWIEAVSGETRDSNQPFAEWLHSGQVLCELANAIRPGIVPRVNSSPLPFKQMENISLFLSAARELGVPESALFSTPDLFEEKNLGAVVNCVYILAGVLQGSCPEFTGPSLGVAITVPSKDLHQKAQLLSSHSSGLATSVVVQRPRDQARAFPVPSVVAEVATPLKSGRAPSPPRDQQPCLQRTHAREGLDELVRPQGPRDCQPRLNRAFAMERLDGSLEMQVTAWVGQVTGRLPGGQDFADWLRSGEVLCALANALRPGIISKVNIEATAPFKQMENITLFMNAARELGVPESAMFGTPDLYEEKNLASVVNCLYTLGGAAQVSCPNFKGPRLGVAMVVESKSKRRQPPAMAGQLGGFSATMEVQRPSGSAEHVGRPSPAH